MCRALWEMALSFCVAPSSATWVQAQNRRPEVGTTGPSAREKVAKRLLHGGPDRRGRG